MFPKMAKETCSYSRKGEQNPGRPLKEIAIMNRLKFLIRPKKPEKSHQKKTHLNLEFWGI